MVRGAGASPPRWNLVTPEPPNPETPTTNALAAGSRDQDLQRLDQLESLFESVRSAPLPVVNKIVREIRTSHGGLKKNQVPVGPWEGLEGKTALV